MDVKTSKPAVKIIVAVLIVLALLFAASFWSMIGANYTRADAQQIAQDHIGRGFATTAEWDWEIWRWVLYAQVHDQGTTFGVYINPMNGEVIRTEGW